MWILATDDAAAQRMTFRIAAGAVKTVGRATGAEFIVDAALVSRLHCQITATAESLHVKDLGSTNGTFVNGERVDTAELHNGDRLSVGRVDLVVHARRNGLERRS
jgi:pSer/pThr/pTyr-binding forkhead associated (FHA) protein